MQINEAALRALILANGFTISSFARDAGIERSHLSNVLAGRRGASPAVTKRMANLLRVPMAAITLPLSSPVAS